MARNYGRTATSIWRDKDFLERTSEARFVYTMLFNQANITACGVLELTITRWSRNTGYTVAVVEQALEELEEHEYVVIDRDTEELLIRTFVKWDGGAGNDLRRRAIRDSAGAVASDRARASIAHQLDRMGIEHGLSIPPGSPVDSASIGTGDGVETRRVVVNTGDHLSNPQPTTRNRNPQPSSATPGGEPSAENAGPPSPFCSKHPNGTEEACGPCGTAKLRYAQHVAATAGREADAKRRAGEMRKACRECDENGFALDGDGISTTFRCSHDSIRAAS